MIRFDSLTLNKLGFFEQRQLAFSPEHRVHVIYGGNGAGKSTLRRALQSFWFGFPSKSQRDDFAFRGNPSVSGHLRIGAQSAELERVVAKTASLKSDAPLPELFDAKTHLLRGFDLDSYCALLSLDSSQLRRGGRALLSSERGQTDALFSAGTGIEDIEARIEALDADCEALFPKTGRGNSSEIAQLIERIKQLREELDATRFSYADLDGLQASQQADQAKRTTLETRLATLRDQQSALSSAALLDRQLTDAEQRIDQQRQAVARAKAKAAGRDTLDAEVLALLVPGLRAVAADLNRMEQRRSVLLEQHLPNLDPGPFPDLMPLLDLPDGAELARTHAAADAKAHDLSGQLDACLAPLALSVDDLDKNLPDAHARDELLAERTRLVDSRTTYKAEIAAIDKRVAAIIQAQKEDDDSAPLMLHNKLMDARRARDRHIDALSGANISAAIQQVVEASAEIDEVTNQLWDMGERASSARVRANDLARLTQDRKILQNRIQTSQERLTDVGARWAKLWQDQALSPVASDAVEALSATLQRGRALRQALKAAEQDRAAAARAVADYRAQLTTFSSGTFAEIGFPEVKDQSEAVLAQQVAAWMQNQTQRKRAATQAQTARDEQADAVAQTDQQIARLIDRWQEEASALDLPTATSVLQIQTQLTQLSEADQLLSTLARTEQDLSHAEDQAETLRAQRGELGDLDELASHQLTADIDALEQDRQALTENITRAQTTLDAKLGTIAPLALKAERERALETLEQKVQAFADRVAARDMLRAALSRARRDAEGTLFADLSQRFSQLTGGAFDRLENNSADSEGWVAWRSGADLEVPVTRLSEGETDQLFLALRLAFLDRHAAAYRLPLVLDDAFQSFDDDRARLAFDAVSALEDRQVLYLTHHPHVADMAASMGAQRLDL